MKPAHTRLIVILLFCILIVLIFGPDAGALIILALLLAVGLAMAVIAFTRYMRRELSLTNEEMRRNRSKGEPWLSFYVILPALPFVLLVLAVAVWRWSFEDYATFKGALESVPLWWLPGGVAACAFVVQIGELIVLRARFGKRPPA